jgi:hypothetical protein
MADEADLAQSEIDLDLHRARFSLSRTTRISPNGACHNCADPVQPNELFCPGGECRDDYEARTRQEARGGNAALLTATGLEGGVTR